MTVTGQFGSGECRIETGRDGEWIEASYRDGWWRRKVANQPSDAYEKMVAPFYLKCRACHRHHRPMCWSVGSPYCPHCEQIFEFAIPAAFERMFGGGES